MSDPRIPFEPVKRHHIYNPATSNESFFDDDFDFYYFMIKLKKHIMPVADILVYCWMTNHCHLVLRIMDEEKVNEVMDLRFKGKFIPLLEKDERMISKTLSRIFSNLFNGYGKYTDHIRHNEKTAFGSAFRRNKIEDSDYLRKRIVYVHHTPVETRLVNEPDPNGQSSYNSMYLSNARLLKRNEVIDLLGKVENFKICHYKIPALQLGS